MRTYSQNKVSNENEWTSAVCNNMDYYHKHKWSKKPNAKEGTRQVSIYMKFKNQVKLNYSV